MNIKVFNIRLAKEFCQSDQDKVNKFLDTVEVKLTSTSFVTNGTSDWWSAVIFYQPKKDARATKLSEEDLLPHEKTIFNALRQWRNDLAGKLKWSSFRICHNSHLIAIAKANPKTLEELENGARFGKTRTATYGEDILSVLNAL